MSFAEKLKEIRRQRGLSQEDLAEILNVSRQAVGKWEQSISYPEAETLIEMSKKLNISLDGLFADETGYKLPVRTNERTVIADKITIFSVYALTTAKCIDVKASQKFNTRGNSPEYALLGVTAYTPFWGEETVVLGWYENEESIKKEIEEIHEAINNGANSYEVKYASKVKKKWGRFIIDK